MDVWRPVDGVPRRCASVACASIAVNVWRGSDERASKATALRRWIMMSRARMARCGRVLLDPRAGEEPGSLAAADPPSSPRYLVDDRPVDARGTERIRLPLPFRGARRLDEQSRISVQPGLEILRRHDCDAFGLLVLGPYEILSALDAEKPLNLVVRPFGQQGQAPAKQRRRSAAPQSRGRRRAGVRNARSPYFQASRQ